MSRADDIGVPTPELIAALGNELLWQQPVSEQRRESALAPSREPGLEAGRGVPAEEQGPLFPVAVDPFAKEIEKLACETPNFSMQPPEGAPAAESPFYFLGGTPATPSPATEKKPDLDLDGVRADFPALHQRVNGKPLVWLDNAATTQKPRAVIDALSRFYERDNSNIHRAAHTLAARATDAYEAAREKVQRFLGASSTREIVFTRGTTESINLVAQSWGKKFLGAGDEILLTTMEHHSNIVPWQMVAQERGAKIKVAPIDDRGEVLIEEFQRLLGPRVKMVAVTHVSNALGTVNPVAAMTQMAQRYGARVLVDGAQAAPHFPVDVQAIGCDFYAFSGHKLFAPTGIGVLYGREEILREMPPWQGGGNMIDKVTFDRTTYADLPAKFEAGTGILAGAVGLGAAIDYLDRIGFAVAARHEEALLAYGTERLSAIRGLRLIGTAPDKAGVLSFVLDGIRTDQMGAFLDAEGIAVRAGHHCAQPTMQRYGVDGTVRASLALYNNRGDLDALERAVRKALSELKR
jgi:cysteine desulfurase/selenocysteine lyase